MLSRLFFIFFWGGGGGVDVIPLPTSIFPCSGMYQLMNSGKSLYTLLWFGNVVKCTFATCVHIFIFYFLNNFLVSFRTPRVLHDGKHVLFSPPSCSSLYPVFLCVRNSKNNNIRRYPAILLLLKKKKRLKFLCFHL